MEEVVAGLELALKKQPPSVFTSRQPNEWSSWRQMIMAKLQQISKKKQQVIADDKKCIPSASIIGCLCPHFSLDEIMKETQNFSNKIGEGDLRSIYLGHINNGEDIVAISRSRSKSEFLMQFEILCKLQHDHVVCLKGYCIESSEMILVYEYLAKGSLDNHLYKRGDNWKTRLTWEQRVNICLGAARGLDFLHKVTEPGIIHRNVNCSNIMLDDNFNPKIADFALAKLVNDGDDAISTHLVGTLGFIAPEYCHTGKVTKKNDVYGFGVVLLVVLSGREPYHNFSGDYVDQPLLTWAIKCINDNKLDKLIDPDLRGQFKSESLEKFLEVAQNCLHMEPEKRYTMEEVVAGLELALVKQHSLTSTQWVESHELEYVDEGESESREYSSEHYKEFMEEYSDM